MIKAIKSVFWPQKPKVDKSVISRPIPHEVSPLLHEEQSLIDLSPKRHGMVRIVSEPFDFRRLPRASELKGSTCSSL